MPAPYVKPYLGIPQQLDLLQQRGMALGDRAKAATCLRRLGYYRLSGYWYPFRQVELQRDDAGRERSVVVDDFRPGTEFRHAAELYVFDKRLRMLLLDAVERIEVALRVDIALLLGKRDPFAHLSVDQLHGHFAKRVTSNGETRHQRWVAKLDDAVGKSNEDFVKHFRQKYTLRLPIWVAIELWDFGMLSTFLGGMRPSDIATIAGYYGLTRSELLPSWVRAINHIRNVCAHHARLWNRSPADQCKPPRAGEIAMLDHVVSDLQARARLYGVAAPMQFLLRTHHPRSSWAARLKQLVSTFPDAPGVNIRQAGFPVGWETLHLWR